MLSGAKFAVGDWRHLDDIRSARPGCAVVVGVSADDSRTPLREVETHGDFEDVFAKTGGLILYLDPHDSWINADVITKQCRHHAQPDPMMSFCIPYRSTPDNDARNDGMINSFVCTPDVFADALRRFEGRGGQASLCYSAAVAAFNQKQAASFHVVSDRRSESSSLPIRRDAVAVVIPHRGELQRLESCLRISTSALHGGQFFVAFDEVVNASHMRMVEAFPNVTFFSTCPQHVGPYVLRQFLAEYSEAEFILFQDSDDASCETRLEVQHDLAVSSGADIVGCHQIFVDEIKGNVQARRFPVDVNAALNCGAVQAQLHPTTLVRRKALLQAGGFSTRRRFGSDREFLFRAHFSSRIVNCDAFLYVRFRREGSLTTSPKTAMGTRFRRLLGGIWLKEFAAVRNGQKSVVESGIRVRHLHRKAYEFKELRTGRMHVYCPSDGGVVDAAAIVAASAKILP
jgi:hypothetical protein